MVLKVRPFLVEPLCETLELVREPDASLYSGSTKSVAIAKASGVRAGGSREVSMLALWGNRAVTPLVLILHEWF